MNNYPQESANKIQEFEAVCRREGLALTVQRRLILETIAGRSDHPSVDQIFEAVKGRVPGISRTTVYRVLETFVRLGIVKRTPNSQDRARFDPNTTHHHHVVCTKCHKIIDLEPGGVEGISLPDGKSFGFEIQDYSIHFLGVCDSCKGQAPGKS